MAGKMSIIFLIVMFFDSTFSQQEPLIPALFAFGDSLVDPGNNNVLATTARANQRPYGIDFINSQPTGRFCNGRLVVDFIASYLGLPYPPAYHEAGNNVLKGANFASASSGVLPETHAQGAEALGSQVNDFERLSTQLARRIGTANSTDLISQSIFYVCIANNDINNAYEIQHRVTSGEEQDIISIFTSNIQRLYSLGARKFVIAGLSAVGCIPLNIVNGRCAPYAQNVAQDYNKRLTTAMQHLGTTLKGVHIVITNFYDLMVEVHDNPHAYGFVDAIHACCPIGSNKLNCSPESRICPDRSKYVFWDGVHQTEAFNKIAASRWWNGSTADVSPMNIKQLAEA